MDQSGRGHAVELCPDACVGVLPRSVGARLLHKPLLIHPSCFSWPLHCHRSPRRCTGLASAPQMRAASSAPLSSCQSSTQPIMMHDCAITERYMLLLDVPLEFDPQVAAEAFRG